MKRTCLPLYAGNVQYNVQLLRRAYPEIEVAATFCNDCEQIPLIHPSTAVVGEWIA